MSVGPARSVQTPLTPERIVGAAMALADDSGIESLTMRRLAQELGVEAMSLYYYFRNKGALLERMLEAVYAEMQLPSIDVEWRASMRTCAISAHRTLLRHPWACNLIGLPINPSLAQLRWMDAILGRLRAAGFSAEMTHHAYHALDSHIVGFTLWVLPYLAISRERPDFAAQVMASLPLAQLPHFAEHVEYHMAEDQPGDTSEFDFGLDLLLDGLERIRAG